MPLENFVKKNVLTVSYDEAVSEIARLMRDNDVGAIVVCDESGRPDGIITDRDIVLRCVAENIDCNQATARDVMTRQVETVPVSAGLIDVIECMRSAEVRRVPLVDETGRAVALLSFGDVFEFLASELGSLAEPLTAAEKKLDEAAA